MKEEQLHSEEERRVDVWASLFSSLDYVGLGLGVLVLVLCVSDVLLPVPPESARLQQQLEQLAQERDSAVRSRHFEPRELLQRSDAAQALLRGTLAGAGTVPQVKDEGAVWPTSVLAALRDEGNVARLLPPEDLVAVALHGAVRLTWRAAARSNVAVKLLEILRAAPGGEYEVIIAVAPTESTWTDSSATPGTLFNYRIVAVCADPLLAASLPRSELSAPVTCGSEADLRWGLIHADATAARFSVERWQGEGFIAKEFRVQQGEMVGAIDPVSGVDFGTGMKLESIRLETETSQRSVAAVVFDAQGRVVLVAGRPQTVQEMREITSSIACVRLQPAGNAPALEVRHRLP